MEHEPAAWSPTGGGKSAKGWPWEALPSDWRDRIAELAKYKGYRTPVELLSGSVDGPWVCPMPFCGVAEPFQKEASQWKDALLSVLRRQNDTPAGELLSLGLAECRRVFGREVSESTWRRHFDLAIQRDNGFQQWGRIDIYLPEQAFTRAAAAAETRGDKETGAMSVLTDAFSQVANSSKLTVEDRDYVWAALLQSTAPRTEALDYAFKAMPGLARTRKALDRAFRRKMRAPKDKRPGKSGRQAPALCPECAQNVTGAAVDLDGDIAQAWRRLHLEKKLCSKCAALWHFDVRTNKSYVPLAVRNQVGPAVAAALPWRHGPKRARLLAPYVLRRRDIGPGDVFEADDVTWNHVFFLWGTDESGAPYVGRGECLLFIDRGSWYPVGYRLIGGEIAPDGRQLAAHYTGVDIRLGVLHVHDRVGLPRLGFQFENGVWKSRLVSGREVRGWRFNLWRDFEAGLNEEGIVFGAAGGTVRHALPGNPRTKIVERMIRCAQERMRNLPGFVGFNHRDYKPELLDDFLRRVKSGKEHPRDMFLSFKEFRDILDAELMAYAKEPQNGRWLHGVSPLEVWMNGIAQFPGVKDSPLRKLPPSARYLLSTHWRKVQVSGQGIRFEVGGRPLVFWGDALLPWQHKALPVRWNIEEPELLHCLPPGGNPFTLKSMELDSWTATRPELAEVARSRNRWKGHGKAIYDKLPHPLLSNVVRDTEHPEETRLEGAAIAHATEEHRIHKEAVVRESKRIAALAGTLGMKVPAGETVTQRAIEARQRRLARLGAETESKP
jgi:hypothetical protein